MTPISVQDVNKYLTLIRVNFENAYKTQTDDERVMLIKSWYEILKEYPKEVCDRAVINAIKNAEYAPRIGSIVKEIESMREAYEKSEMELWAELTSVLNEVEKCAYYFRFDAIDHNGKTQGDNARQRVADIFNELSPELKEYCGNQRGLINIAQIPTDDLQYEKGRFMRTIPTLRYRARKRHEMGDKLAALLYGLSAYTALESDGTKLIKGD